MENAGILHVKVKEAKLTRDTRTFGDMHPTVMLKIKGKQFETRVLPRAGIHPIWNEQFAIPVFSLSMADQLRLVCFDQQTLGR